MKTRKGEENFYTTNSTHPYYILVHRVGLCMNGTRGGRMVVDGMKYLYTR